MRSIKVDITGFQIIEEMHLDLTGITCILGESNEGKTSIYRAVEGCLFNEYGDSFINDEHSRSTVTVAFDEDTDPLIVTRIKPRGKGSIYEINGETHEKVGAGAVAEVLTHGLSPFKTRRDSYRLNFWQQKKEFLVHEVDTKVFDLIAELMSDKDMVPVLKKIKEDCKTLRTQMNVSEKALIGERAALEEIESKLIPLREVDKGDKNLESFAALLQKAAKIAQTLQTVRDLRVQYQAAVTEHKKIERLRNGLKKAIQMIEGEVEKVITASELLEKIQKIQIEREQAESRIQLLSGVIEPLRKVQQLTLKDGEPFLLPAIKLLHQHQEFTEELKQAVESGHRIEEKIQVLLPVTSLAADLATVSQVEPLLRKVQEQRKELLSAEQDRDKTLEVVSTLRGVPEYLVQFDRTDRIQKLLQTCKDQSKVIASAVETQRSISKDIEDTRNEIKIIKEQLTDGVSVCTHCHAPTVAGEYIGELEG